MTTESFRFRDVLRRNAATMTQDVLGVLSLFAILVVSLNLPDLL
jgi:hypothetical protein